MPNRYRAVALAGMLAASAMPAPCRSFERLVLPPSFATQESCQRYARELLRNAESAAEDLRRCQNQDGGTYDMTRTGPWMPDCGKHADIYLRCAPLENELCRIGSDIETSLRECNRQAAGNASSRARQQQQTEESASRIRSLRTAQESARSVLSMQAAPRTYVKQKAISAASSMGKEAARTYGTDDPEHPMIDAAGTAGEKARGSVPMNPVAKEVGATATGSARARMSDAVNKLSRTLGEAASDPAAGGTRPSPQALEEARKKGFLFN